MSGCAKSAPRCPPSRCRRKGSACRPPSRPRLQLRAQQRMHGLRLVRAWRSCPCRSPTPARRRPRSAAAVRERVDHGRSWRFTTLWVCPASRSASVSPMHTMGVSRGRARPSPCRPPLVGFAMVRTPLRMADDHVAAAELGQHRRRYLAGVSARLVRRTILPAPTNARCPAATRPRRQGTGTARTPPHRRPTGLRH